MNKTGQTIKKQKLGKGVALVNQEKILEKLENLPTGNLSNVNKCFDTENGSISVDGIILLDNDLIEINALYTVIESTDINIKIGEKFRSIKANWSNKKCKC